MVVQTDSGVRLFTLLPQPVDSEAVFGGVTGPAESGLYPYELVLTPGKGCGAEFQDAAEDGTYEETIAEGRSA